MNETSLEILRHSAAHIMAQAVQELFPGVKLGIGPAIESGFYYDFDLPEKLTPEDLLKIETRMEQIIKEQHKFIRQELPKAEALKLFDERGEKYKVEIINDLDAPTVSIYKHDKFIDLCRGPHLEHTGQLKAFKLLSIAGAYWRGIETNPMMQRIYATAFESKKELDDYLKNLEEAKKRDHRKLGKELDLFSLHEEAGAGFVYYHPKGAIVRSLIEDFLKKENAKRGYELVYIPHIAKIDLWNTSGHTNYYRENMYFMKIDEQDYVVKPMNCPGHILIFNRKTISYRDLPVRYFELGTVYRYEKSGVLHGLLRVRGFTQDDAHIFCSGEQLKDEIKKVIDFVFSAMKDFGFADAAIELSTRPKDSIGSDEDWDKATSALEDSLKEKGLEYEINSGDGAFYGPKIDIKLKDALKRKWQCATIQCDFALPARFDLKYIDSEGKEKQPVMLHRVILGSLERFLGALLEHYAAAFPLWLAPVQAMIIPVRKEDEPYAGQVKERLILAGLRVELDASNETLTKRIRNAEVEKHPYIIVVGSKEAKENKIALRKRGLGDQGQIDLEEFINKAKIEITNKQ